MAIVQPILVTYLANTLSAYVNKGKVTINGAIKDFAIYKTTIEGSKVRKFLYIENEIGTITQASLVDSAGNLIAIKPVAIEKQEDGIMIVFEFNLAITEV